MRASHQCGSFDQVTSQVNTVACSECDALSLFVNRLVHSGPGKGSPQAGVDLSFATRTGTRQGIETHLFRAETGRDLSHWTRSIVQGCHNSAELVTEVTTGEHCWLTQDQRPLFRPGLKVVSPVGLLGCGEFQK